MQRRADGTAPAGADDHRQRRPARLSAGAADAASRRHADIRTGLSPRAGLALLAAARAWALLSGRSHVLPEDIRALFVPLAAHRLLPARGGSGRSPRATTCWPGWRWIDARASCSASRPGPSNDCPRSRATVVRKSLPIELHRKRIYIVPSVFGAGFSVLLLVMMIGALNYANNAALLLTCLLGAAGVREHARDLPQHARPATAACAGRPRCRWHDDGADADIRVWRASIKPSGSISAMPPRPPRSTSMAPAPISSCTCSHRRARMADSATDARVEQLAAGPVPCMELAATRCDAVLVWPRPELAGLLPNYLPTMHATCDCIAARTWLRYAITASAIPNAICVEGQRAPPEFAGEGFRAAAGAAAMAARLATVHGLDQEAPHRAPRPLGRRGTCATPQLQPVAAGQRDRQQQRTLAPRTLHERAGATAVKFPSLTKSSSKARSRIGCSICSPSPCCLCSGCTARICRGG